MEHLQNTTSVSRKWLTILLCLTILLSPPGIVTAKEKKLGNNLSISMKNDRIVGGELLAVQDNVLIILNRAVQDTSHVSITEVTHIHIEKKSKFLKGAGRGFLTGGMIGAILGFAIRNDSDGFITFTAVQNALIMGTSLGTIGAAVGGIGGVIAGIDETVSIKSTSSDNLYPVCNKMKKYARYEGALPEDFKIEPVTSPGEDSPFVAETTSDIGETQRYNHATRTGGLNTHQRFHINITPGYFKSSGVDEIKDLIQSLGFADKQTISLWWFGTGVTTTEYPRTLKNRNLYFKDIKLEYSLNSTFTVGMAYSPLGEHGASGRRVVRGLDYREFRDEEDGRTPYEYVDTYIIGFYKGHAYFLTASYFPIPDAFFKKQTIKATVGIGYIRTAFDFYGSEWEHSYNRSSEYSPVDHTNFALNSFGILLSAELRHFFNKRVSIGVNADYKYVPVKTNGFSINAPYSYYDGPSFEGGERQQGALHVDIPDRTWNLGGLGFGVSMGLHF
jgi:small nuclear ribonucleoprotein (snRNP)-like protein